MLHLERVCLPCWAAASRQVQRQPVAGSSQHTVESAPETGIMDGNIITDTMIPVPPPLPPLVPQPTSPQEQQLSQSFSKINSQKYKRVSASSRHCLFPGCANIERLLVPGTLKEVLLLNYKVYIPLSARICRYHLNSNRWDELEAPYSDFTGFQVDDIFSKLEKATERQLDFNDINSMDSHLCHYWLGLTAEQFNELLNCNPLLYNHFPNPSVALSIFLVKLRTGDSNQRLSTLFKMPRSTLEKKINIVRNCLNEQFVPRYLGINR